MRKDLKREATLERIRNKPMVRLTAEEIDMLPPQEQRWVYGYRAEVRRRDAEGAAKRKEDQRARVRLCVREKRANRIPF